MRSLIHRARALARRHSARTWLLWALGALVLAGASAGLGDPALWVLLLDPEFVAVSVLIGVALLRENGRGALDYLLGRVGTMLEAAGRPRAGRGRGRAAGAGGPIGEAPVPVPDCEQAHTRHPLSGRVCEAGGHRAGRAASPAVEHAASPCRRVPGE
jgi:hypothetical protein